MTTPWAGRWRQARPYDSGLISHACILLLRSLVANKILKLKDLLMLPDITKILTYLNAGSALLVRRARRVKRDLLHREKRPTIGPCACRASTQS